MNRLTVRRYGRIIAPYSQGQILIAFARSFLITKCRTIKGEECDIELQLTNLGEEIGDFSPFRTGLNVFLKDGFSCLTFRNRGEEYIDFECLCCPDIIESASVSNVVSVANAKSFNPETGVESAIPLVARVTGTVAINDDTPIRVQNTENYAPFDVDIRVVNAAFVTVSDLGKTAFLIPAFWRGHIYSSTARRVYSSSAISDLNVSFKGIPFAFACPFWIGYKSDGILVDNSGNETAQYLRFAVSGV